LDIISVTRKQTLGKYILENSFLWMHLLYWHGRGKILR
jgi:hypothetical protein